jgi:hypothetical protein
MTSDELKAIRERLADVQGGGMALEEEYDADVSALLAEVERARAAALEEALREADEEAAEYECNAAACDAAGHTRGGAGDLHGALACRAVAKRIRALLAEPRPASPSSDTEAGR